MTVTVSAYAKINLTLEILGRRPDGYHDIVSVLQAISLHDLVSVDDAPNLTLDAPDVGCAADDNLVLQAARLIREEHAPGRGARLRLIKRIPAAAGLGGGSSDAAATLVALNRLCGLGLGRERLSALAARLGSDVPFFLHGPTALARGRGELLERLPAPPASWAVIVVPPVQVPAKTRTLYGSLVPTDWTDGAAGLAIAEGLLGARGLDTGLLCNAFERAAFSLYPAIADHRAAMLGCGAPFVRLSGSGPSLFTLVSTAAAARSVAGRLTAQGRAALLARCLRSRRTVISAQGHQGGAGRSSELP